MFQGLRRCAAAAILAVAVFGFPAMALAQGAPPPCDIPLTCGTPPPGDGSPPPGKITWSGMSTADGQQIKGILDGDGLSINKDGTWLANAQRDAKKLFKLLFPLEIAVTGIILLFRARDWGDAVSNFTMKLLAGTCFLVLISNAGVIFNAIPAWFAGEAMSITGYQACATWLDKGKCDEFAPGSVVAKGIDVAGHMNEAFGKQLDTANKANGDDGLNPIDKVKGIMAGLMNGIMLLPAVIMLFLADIIVMAAFLVMAATLAITQVEAQILGAVGAVVLGFAAFRYTNSYSEKFISLAFSVGAKLFLIYVMLAVTDAMMTGAVTTLLAGDGATTLISPLAMLKVPLVAIFAMILVWKIPQLASSFSSGTTGMNLGGVISSSLAIAGAALAATGAGAAIGAKGAAAINEKMNAASLAKAAGSGGKAEPATAPVSDTGTKASAPQMASSVQPGGGASPAGGASPGAAAPGGANGSASPSTPAAPKQVQPPFKPASGALPDVKGNVPNAVPSFPDVGGDGTGEAPSDSAPESVAPDTADREPVTTGGAGPSASGGSRGRGGSSTGGGSNGGAAPPPGNGSAGGGGAPPDNRRLIAAMERIAAHFEAGGGVGGGGGFTPADLSRAVAQGVQQSSLAEKIGHSVGSAVNPRRNRPAAPNRLMALSYKLSDLSDFAGDPKHLNLIETLAMGTAVAGQHGSVSGHNTGASI